MGLGKIISRALFQAFSAKSWQGRILMSATQECTYHDWEWFVQPI
jgi:hypothetical protein